MFPNNSFYFKDEIRHMKKCNSTVDIKMSSQNYEFSKKYLAITIIMSKCNYIICGSGNCDIWIMLYRGNNNNVIQNLNGSTQQFKTKNNIKKIFYIILLFIYYFLRLSSSDWICLTP